MAQLDSGLLRRLFVGAALSGLATGTLPPIPETSALAQPGRNEPARGERFFSFPINHARALGVNKDESLPSAVYETVGAWLNRELAKTGGKMELESDYGKCELKFKSNEERPAVDFIKTVTRDIWRNRRAQNADGTKIRVAPTEEEIVSAVEHVLTLRLYYKDTPMMVTVLGADAEFRNGKQNFGTKEELDAHNAILKAHGAKNAKTNEQHSLSAPYRTKREFLAAIENTPPVVLPDGSLYFSACFNGHGAEHGQGMSFSSQGADRLSGLLKGPEVALALEKHFKKWGDLYAEAHKDHKKAFVGVMFFCCYSQDQGRRQSDEPMPWLEEEDDAPKGQRQRTDLMSRLEILANNHRVRPFLFTVSETDQPGLYRPGARDIPVNGVWAIGKRASEVKWKLTIGDLFPEIMFGGYGIHSNPSLFVPDIRKPRLYQIGQAEPAPMRLKGYADRAAALLDSERVARPDLRSEPHYMAKL
jgi:hypothetical protein